jgi:hypothetical protein
LRLNLCGSLKPYSSSGFFGSLRLCFADGSLLPSFGKRTNSRSGSSDKWYELRHY